MTKLCHGIGEYINKMAIKNDDDHDIIIYMMIFDYSVFC